jgi:flagellar biosynthesis/type III secretory pathway M-ring protein FliF/YscJ
VDKNQLYKNMQNETNNKLIISLVSIVLIVAIIIFAFWYFGNNEEMIIEDNITNEEISTSTENIDINNQNPYQNQTGTSSKIIPENNFDYKG